MTLSVAVMAMVRFSLLTWTVWAFAVAAMEAVGEQLVVSNPLEKHYAAMKMYMKQQVLLGATSVFLMQSPRWQPIRHYAQLIMPALAEVAPDTTRVELVAPRIAAPFRDHW